MKSCVNPFVWMAILFRALNSSVVFQRGSAERATLLSAQHLWGRTCKCLQLRFPKEVAEFLFNVVITSFLSHGFFAVYYRAALNPQSCFHIQRHMLPHLDPKFFFQWSWWTWVGHLGNLWILLWRLSLISLYLCYLLKYLPPKCTKTRSFIWVLMSLYHK